MPITQDRVIAIIEAGQDYQQALEGALAMFRSEAQRVTEGLTTAEQALESLDLLLASVDVLLLAPSASASCLAREAKHFEFMKKRNERERWRQQRARERKASELVADLGASATPKPVRNLEHAASSTPSPNGEAGREGITKG